MLQIIKSSGNVGSSNHQHQETGQCSNLPTTGSRNAPQITNHRGRKTFVFNINKKKESSLNHQQWGKESKLPTAWGSKAPQVTKNSGKESAKNHYEQKEWNFPDQKQQGKESALTYQQQGLEKRRKPLKTGGFKALWITFKGERLALLITNNMRKKSTSNY